MSAFSVKKSVIGAAVSFVNRKQKQAESIETYSKVLNELASQCGYSDCCRDRLLRDIFISGLRSSKLISVLITECELKKFSDCVDRAKIIEQVTLDVQDINPDENLHTSYKVENTDRRYSNNNKTQSDSGRSPKTQNVPKNYKCIRCGTTGKHFVNDCFALNLRCNKCQKTGHIAKVCKTKQATARSSYLAPEEEDPAQYISIYNVSRECHPSSSKYAESTFRQRG